MSADSERNKDVIRRFIHRVTHDLSEETFEEFISPRFVDHYRAPEQPPGVEGVKHTLKRVMASLSDLRVEIGDLIAEADKVVVRYTVEATHVGSFMGFPGSGKKVVLSTISIYRMENGKIAERWGLIDHASLLRQLRGQPP